MASFAFAPPCVRRASPAKAAPIQAKLEVGPSHDRFEAEADRVAQSVLSSTGPSSAPSISPLGSGSATRKPMQREEQRPIAKREEDKTEQSKSSLTKILQPKSDTNSSLEDQKKSSKKSPSGKVQAKSSPAPKPKKEDKVQKKGLESTPAQIQSKANPRPQEDEKKAQKKPAAHLQAKSNPRPQEDEKKVQKKPIAGSMIQPRADPRPQEDEKVQKKSMPGGALQAKASPKPKEENKKAQKKAADGAQLQTKPSPKPQEDHKKAQKKPAAGAQLQMKASPKPKEDDKKAQKKLAAHLQAKSNPRPQEDPKKVQKKSLTGTVQRDDVDDDTVRETSIQAKRNSGGLQREVAKADAVLATEEKEEPKKAEAAPVQRAASSADGFTAPSAVEAGIASMQGGGTPLAADVRSDLEPRFGRDLSGVRIHSGSRAGDLSNSVSARAFTIGQDIFFGAGQYQPKTSGGRALLAHELTHTIQQQGGSSRAQPARIQRANDKSKASTGANTSTTPDENATPQPDSEPFKHARGTIQVGPGGNILTMNELRLPQVGHPLAPKGKTGFGSPGITAPFTYYGKKKRGETARQQWMKDVSAEKAVQQITELSKNSPVKKKSGEPIAYLRPIAKQHFLLIGSATELAGISEVKIPTWNQKGEATLFDVDHIHELQLGGLDGPANFWLLDQGSNRSSGKRISDAMQEDFDAVVGAALTGPTSGKGAKDGGKKGEKAGKSAGGPSSNWFAERGVTEPKWDYIRSDRYSTSTGTGNAAGPTPASAAAAGTGWQITYKAIGKLELGESAKNAFWTKEQIAGGEHIKSLAQLTPKEIHDQGLEFANGPKSDLTANIYVQQHGGFFRTIRISGDKVETVDKFPVGAAATGKGVAGNQFWKGFAVGEGDIKMDLAPPGPDGKARTILGAQTAVAGKRIGTISGQPFPASGEIKSPRLENIEIIWEEKFGYGGYIPMGWITNEKLARLAIEGASPIKVQEAGLTPTGELFANGTIESTKALFPGLRIPIYLRGNEIGVSFPLPQLDFGPVHAKDVAVDIGYGQHGFFLTGGATIVVDRVGEGTIKAKGGADPTLEGDFKFNMDFLKNPTAHFKYTFSDDKIELKLGAEVDKGKLPGVESGHVGGTFSREKIELDGNFNLAAPLQGSQIILHYDREQGIIVEANDIPLPISKIPGITDAKLSAKASMNPDDGEWHVSGTGSATFSMPPATGTLSVGLDGTRLMITGSAGFQQGIASGTVNVTATNAQLDEAGQPIPDKVADKFSIWGSGSASLKFGILTGTAGLKLNPDGSVIIDGEIALPPTHEVFKKQEYKKPLFHPPALEFPIWGISIAGYGIGIMGFVDAKLDFDAYVGPGTLNDTKVKVTFALDKPEEAVVDGTAAFVVPAGAGLTLDIGGGLKASAAVGYVKGRIGLDARLGLEAEARADMLLHWTQMEGLSLAAKAHAEAHPRFDVGVNASVTAGVDLWVTEVEHTWGPWRKQLGSFGPEMNVGVTVPIAWSEKGGLDFDVNKIEIQKPEIDFPAIMKDAFLELV